jgi:hypothetical protein
MASQALRSSQKNFLSNNTFYKLITASMVPLHTRRTPSS